MPSEEPFVPSDKTHDYHLVSSFVIKPTAPLLNQDLLSLYSLTDLADSVARFNADGSKGVKLRKSYKGHVMDLPGKHQIPKERNLSGIIFQPTKVEQGMPPVVIKKFSAEEGQKTLLRALQFQKTNAHEGIPGFDVAELAMDDSMLNGVGVAGMDSDLKKRKKLGGYPEESKRVHV
ncbi:hypothetical protein BABINDRAFT_164172 [Babjeviella inositovora NRRL Y-12698]|uniref:Mediator of RNA polymerase II transcription subunit 19 n=1 Tax=Babjeviella inositovora NRRL Y-12698 TaxID=984486 RepID=A0A1E3QXG8_9ASCO|nr:uncharacterized protein BABINDRAFT_164172 [Babjeviella inositovora NRRL Y-12698]ODQ82365.1 hypothetical protein BABINDRAFT_164172 [Babjeviella inositovora NRRL Y-12698]